MQDSDAPAHVQALSLGERLRRHRIESGLTQEELAERAGLSVRGLSDLERGVRRFPYPDTIERLADVLKIGEQQRAALQHARRQAKSPSGGRPTPEPSPDALPSGMVTFVFTDVEGSTSAWEHDPDAMRAALARHDVLIESLVAQHGGHVVRPRGEGDSRFVVFVRTSDAVAAACAVQRAFVHERWPTPEPVRVRMALHTGEADLRGGDYYGSAVNRCARLRAIAHGGQVVLSGVTADLVRGSLPADTGLRDLGQHRLKDLGTPERVWQLTHPDLPSNFPALNSIDTRRHNLPIQLSSFVGREQQVSEVKRLCMASRLVTLTGVGGVGKTRLAVQVAAALAEAYADGVCVVELAPIGDPALVPQAVAAVLGIRDQPRSPLQVVLADALQSRGLLLVLDNCEHVVEACARLADELLRACPSLHVLTTSREALRVSGETVWSVPPLSLPDTRTVRTVEGLGESEAVTLFCERCRAVQPGFALTPENATTVAEVCRQLNGIPLALELAAARVRVLGVEQIAVRLTDHLGFLTGGSRAAPPRQQTLRGAIEWSYRLLTDQERLLFERLSVFSGSFPLEAVEAVCTADGRPGDVLDLLQGLADKSLVAVEPAADTTTTRYRLLETLRQYGQERLRATGAADSISARHAAFFADLVETLGSRFHGPGLMEYLKRLEQEHDNIRSALHWLVDRQDGDTALRFALMAWFWDLRGHWSEGRAWLEQVLALPCREDRRSARSLALLLTAQGAWLQGDMAAAAQHAAQSLATSQTAGDQQLTTRAQVFLGLLLWIEGDHAAARSLTHHSLALARKIGDRWTQSRQLEQLGMVALWERDLEAAGRQIGESVRLAREAGDAYSLTIALNFLGDVMRVQCADDQAEAAYAESLAINDALGDVGYGPTLLHNLGYLALARGDLARAASMLGESLARVRRRGEKRGTAECLMGFAGIARAQGQHQLATQLLGAAEATLESIGASVWTTDRAFYDREVAAVHGDLEEEAFTSNWSAGRALSLDRAMAIALAVIDSTSSQTGA